jgi:S-formylglutathione hydrolase FrmB
MKTNGIALMIDCGVDDFLIETNRQMHELLLENGTPHDYIERPGAHTWQYWTDALPYHMLFVSRAFYSEKP